MLTNGTPQTTEHSKQTKHFPQTLADVSSS